MNEAWPTHLSPKRPRHARRSGIVLIITLLGLILIAALVMYVINIGRQVNERVTTQHAADASVIGGAGWVARSLNTVAMNNVAMAHQIALVSVLDSMPKSVRFTLEDQVALEEVIREQLGRGPIDSWVTDSLNTMHGRVLNNISILTPIDTLLNEPGGIDVTEMTYYDHPSVGRGRIWLAMESLDQLSQVTVETMGPLAQLNAKRAGEVNFYNRSGSDAVMVPVLAGVPWRRGDFDDFERPVKMGLLPEAIDDPRIRRGPYDTVFGWRDPVGGEREGYYEGPDDIAGGGRGNAPISGGIGRGGRWVVTRRDPDAYRVHGPVTWMRERLGHFGWTRLPYARLASRNHQMSRVKLKYLWPGGGPLGTIIDPDWITTWAGSTSVANNNPSRIRETAFIAVEIKSRYPRNHPSFLSPGSWAYVDRRHQHEPRLIYSRGWQDPRTWSIPQVANYIWRDEWDYQVFYDNEVGISVVLDPTTQEPIAQPIYRVDSFVFAGVNVGTDVTVLNPYNVASRSDLPAPIDLDHAALPAEDAYAARDQLTFLGMAWRNDRAVLWPSRFRGGKPSAHIAAIAEARVFNNHSWDLWTQMWHAQLQPVDDYENWVSRMETSQADLSETPYVSADVYAAMLQYLTAATPVAEEMLTH